MALVQTVGPSLNFSLHGERPRMRDSLRAGTPDSGLGVTNLESHRGSDCGLGGQAACV